MVVVLIGLGVPLGMVSLSVLVGVVGPAVVGPAVVTPSVRTFTDSI